MLQMYQALPSYFGGKRKLAAKIMNYAEGKTFIDAFMGAGSVSLLAKARGFKVIANDIAERSGIVGRALITNTDTILESSDVDLLFTPHPETGHYVRDCQSRMFKAEICDFLDNAFAHISQINDPIKRDLMMLLWIKVIIYYRPMGTFTHPGAVEKLERDEAVTPVLEHLQELYSKPLYRVVCHLAEEINSGVFDNGLDNEMHSKDVFNFLPSVQGDVVYFDPPYYGAQSYEYYYRVLDSMIAQKDVEPKHSVFNTKQVIANTMKLFECSQHIPLWIMSIGQRIIDKKKYIELMGSFRQVIDVPVKYAYSFGTGHNEEAGAQEVLLIGRA